MENKNNKTVVEQPEVLVVEDDLFFSVRIETTLKRLGYGVQVVVNGAAAVARAAQHPPALVIVNFGSAKLTPGEVVKQLKALPHPAPVLGFVSHKWIPQVRPNALAAGVDLLVANSALSMRLPQLVARLAPLDGSAVNMQAAAQVADDAEEEPSGAH
jgi:two-component system KDP operon response regulator KdpE